MDRQTYDVIVAGGGPAGVAAALSAARNGARTLLIEKNPFLGGCAASGLPFVDFFNRNGRQVIAGVAEDLINRLFKEKASLGHIKTGNGHLNSITMVDPEWVKISAEEMLLEVGCHLLYNSFVCKADTEGGTLHSVTVANKGGLMELVATCFVDATGDGDLAAFAGAQWEKGRDSDGLSQAMSLLFRLIRVDVKTVTDQFGMSPIITSPLGTKEVYNVHVNGKLTKWNDILKEQALFDHSDHNLWAGTTRHDELTYVNTVRIAGKDSTDPWQLTEAEIEGRRQMKGVYQFLVENVDGFRDAYIGAVQYGIGIRESRRIMGEYVLTADDILTGRKFDDAICQNGYCIDIHDPKGKKWESREIESKDKFHHIPYRTLVPKTLDGLLVAGRCLSATHEAMGSTRIMPTCMATGQAAGTAAAMAVEAGVSARKLDTAALKKQLQADGAII